MWPNGVRPAIASLTPARLARLLGGQTLYGVAIGMIVQARLGVGPWDVLAQGVQLRTGISFGLASNLIGALVLLLWWPLKQRPGIGTVANVLLVGSVADVALRLVGAPSVLSWQVMCFAVGLVLLAVATGIYVGAGLGAGPRDGLMLGVQRRLRLPLWAARASIEGIVLVAGALLGGNVGIGTVAFAILIGPLCHIAVAALGPRLKSA